MAFIIRMPSAQTLNVTAECWIFRRQPSFAKDFTPMFHKWRCKPPLLCQIFIFSKVWLSPWCQWQFQTNFLPIVVQHISLFNWRPVHQILHLCCIALQLFCYWKGSPRNQRWKDWFRPLVLDRSTRSHSIIQFCQLLVHWDKERSPILNIARLSCACVNIVTVSPSAGATRLEPTSACRRLLAPLAGGLALGGRRPFQSVAFVAGEAHHVIVVEAVASGASVDGAARVAAGDGWQYSRGWKEKETVAMKRKGSDREKGGAKIRVPRGWGRGWKFNNNNQ